MSKVGTLLNLDLKSRFGFGLRVQKANVFKWLFSSLFTLTIYAIIVTGIVFITKIFVLNGSMNYHFLVLTTAVSMTLQLVVCTATLVKALYFNGDNEILLRFPVSGDEIFLAKSAYVFINSIIVSSAILLPIYISFGIFSEARFAFYIWIAVVNAFSSLLPFFVANIIAIPVMYVVNLIKDKFLIILIIMIGIVVGSFAIYMAVLKNILVYIQTEELSLFTPEIVAQLDKFVRFAYPFKFYANLLVGQDTLNSFIMSLLITIISVAFAALVVKKWYFATILKSIETEKSSFTKKSKNQKLPVFLNIMKREFLLVFRSVNYSFQYLCMAIAAPVMVYYCNDIAAAVGTASIGGRFMPGLTLLVVTIFVTIIVSFAATAVSREGHNFYHTKNMPVTFTKQIFIKFVLYGGVAFLSVCLSCVVVVAAKFVNYTDALFIWSIAELVVIMQTSIALRADTVAPSFNVMGDGEIVSANKNLSLSIALGLFLACLYGISAMILSYIPVTIGNIEVLNGEITKVYFYLLGLTGLLAAISVAALFVGLEKRYMNITEQ